MRPRSVLIIALIASTICSGAFAAASVSDLQQKVVALTTEARNAYTSRQFTVAEQKYNQVVSLTAGAPAKFRITLLSNLGATYRENHKYVEAENTFKKALAIAEASHLNYAPATKMTMQQYALLLRKLKRDKEADDMEIRSAAGVVPETQLGGSGTAISSGAPHAVPKDLAKHAVNVEVPPELEKMTVADIKAKLQKDSQNWVLWAQLGVLQSRERQWKVAAESFKTSLNRSGGIEDDIQEKLRYSMACCYVYAGEADEALETCRKLYSDKPGEVKYNRLMSYCYELLGDMRAELDVDEAYLQHFQGDSDYATVSQHVERLRRDVQNTQKAAAERPNNQPNDSEITKSFVKAQMPLKVYIDQRHDDSMTLAQGANTAITDSTPGELIQRAMEAWSQASQGRVQFAFCDQPEVADIRCDFSGDAGSLEMDSVAGVTSREPTVGGKMQAVIHLLTVDSRDGKPVTRAEFAQTALHEFGHALGLEHSNHTDDVMYRSIGQEPVAALSDNDRDRIMKLYSVLH